MKKLIPIIAIIPMLLLALCPPWEFKLDCSVNSLMWLWSVLISGFLAFLFIYQKVSAWLKLFIVWCFISCFMSRAPFISFTMYWSLIACAYYYALCRKIEDWTPVYKTIQAIFFLSTLLIIMQYFGKDTLLNFGQSSPRIMGIIGNKMMSSSYACILAPFLLINPLNLIPLFLIALISSSMGSTIALIGGMAILLCFRVKNSIAVIIGIIISILAFNSIPLVISLITPVNKVVVKDTAPSTTDNALVSEIKTFESKAGRLPVWKKTLELSLKRPIGYGPATYKVLFPYMCGAEIRDQCPGQEWNVAHNTFLQILFETGFIGFILLFGWIVSIVLNVLKDKNYVKLAGLVILASCMMTQFPDRMVQTVLIIIMFLAWCSSDERKYVH